MSEEIPAGATQFKCCPPIREAGNRELLWQGLADCVVTDHSPCTVDLKRFDIGDFSVASGGIASLQISLSAVRSEAKRRGHSLNDVVRHFDHSASVCLGRPLSYVGRNDLRRIWHSSDCRCAQKC